MHVKDVYMCKVAFNGKKGLSGEENKEENRGDVLAKVHMLHFKAMVTSSGHLSDKIFISSHFMKNLKTYPCNMAYMLYFQKIVGFTSLGRLEMQL